MFARQLRVLVLTVAFVAAVPTAGAMAEEPPGLPVQLELGDSWTYGEGAPVPAEDGYAGVVYESNLTALDCIPARADEAADGCRQLQRIIMARPGTAENPGVTTDLLISQQLDPATAEIMARNNDSNPRNDVEVILISVGGNDVSAPILQACLGGLDPTCLGVINERIGHVDDNLDVIFGALRQAAGPETKIATITYDNAIANCDLAQIPGATELADLVLEGYSPLGITGLNDVIRENATAHGLSVGDTFGRLDVAQWVGGQDCLHPNGAGHAEVGQIVTAAIQG